MAERNLSDSKTAIFRYIINEKGYVLRDCVYGEHSPVFFKSNFILLFGATLLIRIVNSIFLLLDIKYHNRMSTSH